MYSSDGDITNNYITNKLTACGIAEGDTVMISCRLPFIGKLATAITFVDLSKIIIENISTLIGEKGTIVVPSYSYSFCMNNDFDQKNTPSTLGDFFETFRQQYAVGRTLDPIFSVCAKGKNTDFLINGPNDNCFGEKSFFGRFHSLPDAKFLLIGLNYHNITNFHFVEQINKISYRYIKEFPGKIIMPDGSKVARIQKYFVRNLDLDYEFKNFFKYIEKNELSRVTKFGNTTIKMIKEKVFFNAVTSLLKKKENFFLKI